MSARPILLDLFCGAGGCTKGYQEAGFYVVGVDIDPQPNYCGDVFHQADALEVLAALVGERDVDPLWPSALTNLAGVHASPPCQNKTKLKARWRDREHPELIAETRELLISSGLPYAIENVEGAREALIEPKMLCGSVFGLGVRRHRLFETNFPLDVPRCAHTFQPYPVPVYGHSGKGANRGRERELGRDNSVEEWRAAMQIDWMTGKELAQAIPPAFTRHIGAYLLAHIDAERKVAA